MYRVGGFVGVDVFFVISGFLITNVIRSACKIGSFSFYDFYARRLTRLHPALLATVSISLVAGYILMDSASLVSLSQASMYSILSGSNILFWNTQDYFDASAAMQPLLHTWSLSVEWQFYLVWPFIIWATLKVSERLLIRILAAIAVASVTASQWMLGVDSSASYFLMPLRGFELAIGALLVFTKGFTLRWNAEFFGAPIGLTMIIASAFYLESKSPFPGIAALVPCIGAALCIQFGTSAAGGFLRLAPMVRIGLISYSVYLVHWPILVFTKYFLFRELTESESITFLFVSVIAGQALYSFVEKPFIAKGRSGRPISLAAVISGTAIISACSLALVNNNGAPYRIPEKYAAFIENLSEFHIKNFGGSGYADDTPLGAQAGGSQFLLAGDSFAMQYASGMDALLMAHNIGAQGQFSLGCFLARTHTRFENGTAKSGCQERYKSVIAYLKTNKSPLVLSMNWSGYLPYISDLAGNNLQFATNKQYEQFISDSLEELIEDAGERKVFIVGVAPFLAAPVSSASCMLRPSYIHQACEDRLKYRVDETFAYDTNKALRRFAESRPNTYFIDPADVICKEGMCSAAENGAILFSDGVHLSKEGSRIVAKAIYEAVESSM